jgi:DNA-binding NarL/FixJ family response regulator
LIAPTTNDTWELRERADDDQITIGLPDDPTRAKRAGRDEVIRRMSAHGLPHTEIAEITGLSRSTIDIAVNRARALRIDDGDDDDVDLTTIAMRVSALLDVIDHAQE